jgi:PAS domain S-box-containing protein
MLTKAAVMDLRDVKTCTAKNSSWMPQLKVESMPREVMQALSPREDEILRLAAQGFTDAGIAYKLGISEGTVGTYWGRVRTKMGPYPRTELIAIRVRSEMESKLDAANLHQEEITNDDELYHQIVSSAEEGIILADTAGLVIVANEAAHIAFGYSPGALRRQPLSEIVPERYRAQHATKFKAFCENPRFATSLMHVEVEGRKSDGSEVPLVVSVWPLRRGDELVIAAFIQPLTRCNGIPIKELEEIGFLAARDFDSNQDGKLDADEVHAAVVRRRSQS